MRKARQKLNMSQKTLSDLTLFTPSYISGIEKGTVIPSERAIHLIAQHLKKRVEYFTNESVSEEESAAPILTAASTSENEVANSRLTETGIKLEYCRLLNKERNYQECLQILNNLDWSKLTPEESYTARFLQAQVLARSREPKKARDILLALKNEPLTTDPSLPDVLFEVAVTYQAEQNFTEAIESYEALLQKLGPQADYALQGFRTYAELGKVCRQAGQLEQAARNYERAYHHPQARQNERTLAGILKSRAKTFIEKGQFAQAQQALEESRQLYEKLEQIEDARAVASYLSTVRAEIGQETEEIVAPDNFSPLNEVTVKVNRAVMLRYQALRGDTNLWPQAIEQMKETLKYLNSHYTEIRAEVASEVYLEAARLWVTQNEREEAIRAFDCALDALRQSNSNAHWSQFEKIYDEYATALLDWNHDLVVMTQQQLKDRRSFTNKT
jgi:tetratricopeptide (TPR) repeat protein